MVAPEAGRECDFKILPIFGNFVRNNTIHLFTSGNVAIKGTLVWQSDSCNAFSNRVVITVGFEAGNTTNVDVGTGIVFNLEFKSNKDVACAASTVLGTMTCFCIYKRNFDTVTFSSIELKNPHRFNI